MSLCHFLSQLSHPCWETKKKNISGCEHYRLNEQKCTKTLDKDPASVAVHSQSLTVKNHHLFPWNFIPLLTCHIADNTHSFSHSDLQTFIKSARTRLKQMYLPPTIAVSHPLSFSSLSLTLFHLFHKSVCCGFHTEADYCFPTNTSDISCSSMKRDLRTEI